MRSGFYMQTEQRYLLTFQKAYTLANSYYTLYVTKPLYLTLQAYKQA